MISLQNQVKAVRAAIVGNSSLIPFRAMSERRRMLESRCLMEDLNWVEKKLKIEIKAFWSTVFVDNWGVDKWETRYGKLVLALGEAPSRMWFEWFSDHISTVGVFPDTSAFRNYSFAKDVRLAFLISSYKYLYS